MKKTIFTLLFCVSLIAFSQAQDTTVKGRVIEANSGEPVSGAQVNIQESIYSTTTDVNGNFSITDTNLPLGEQVLLVEKLGYTNLRFPVTIQSGSTLTLDPIIIEVDFAQAQAQIGLITLADDELDEEDGISTNVSGLLQASRDTYLSAAAFDFSATFFRPRGLDNEYGKILINGVEMNKLFNGRPQWSNWGGLNDVTRYQEFTMGSTANEYTFGSLAGTTNINLRASRFREGGQVSFASSNRTNQGRIMASYNSGSTASGWAYSIMMSRRYGQEGYIEGTVYDANSFFASVEKTINANHSINFVAFYTPNLRGRSAPITQEVYDLKGGQYNPFWGKQEGDVRNSRTREISEPVVMLNHYWTISDNTHLNTNLAYQFGKTGNTRIDNNGTNLMTIDGQSYYIGGARNPDPHYYQRLPSYFLRFDNPTPYNYQNAYLAEQSFRNNGQFDWNKIYYANFIAREQGKNAVYALQEDRVDDTQISINTILNHTLNQNITLNAGLNFRSLKSENFAAIKDLFGATGYLDIDTFAEDTIEIIAADVAQSDLRNRDRIVQEGDRYKYNYEIDATVAGGFAQAQFKYRAIDFYLAAEMSQTSYQRNGLFENGFFPGEQSFGKSEKLEFTDYGVKGGLTYKITGRHLIDFNGVYMTQAPGIRNSFANARQNNSLVVGIDSEKIHSVDLSYIFRSPIFRGRITGFYTGIQDASDIGFFFTQSISGQGPDNNNAFVQEITTGMDKRMMGIEFGAEAQVTPTIKLIAAGSIGEYIYNNNPNIYYTSTNFDERITFGDGTVKLKNYRLSGGPEKAFQLGFEYRDPNFWWIGASANYFSDAYINISKLRRTDAFSSDFDGLPFNDYDEAIARGLLKQERFDDLVLVNLKGGKSWRINNYFVGFFASINNVFNQQFKTGGFEDSRTADYRRLVEESNRETPVFGNRYFFGFGTTYFVNAYFRF